MYLPDLFGSYIKGRQAAIGDNWKDLENYEKIEAARNKNDMDALEIIRERAKLGGDLSMFYDNVNESARNNQINETAHAGRIALADMGSRDAGHRWQAYVGNESAMTPYYSRAMQAKLAEGIYNSAESLANYGERDPHLNGSALGQGYNISTQQGVIDADTNKAAATYLNGNARFKLQQQPITQSTVAAENKITNITAENDLAKKQIAQQKAIFEKTPVGKLQGDLATTRDNLNQMNDRVSQLATIVGAPGGENWRNQYNEALATLEEARKSYMTMYNNYANLRGQLPNNYEFGSFLLPQGEMNAYGNLYFGINNTLNPPAQQGTEPALPPQDTTPPAVGTSTPIPNVPPHLPMPHSPANYSQTHRAMVDNRIKELSQTLTSAYLAYSNPSVGLMKGAVPDEQLPVLQAELDALVRMYGGQE